MVGGGFLEVKFYGHIVMLKLALDNKYVKFA